MNDSIFFQLALPAIVVLFSIIMLYMLSRRKKAPKEIEEPVRRWLPPYLSREEMLRDIFNPGIPLKYIAERARYILVEHPEKGRRKM